MEEREERYFDIRGIILKVLFLLLFVFLVLWLAPLPNLKQVNDTLFNENVENMQDAAKSYYTDERLPQLVGQKKSLTLQEMLDLKILLPFLDSNGKTCNTQTSYVEVTKMENEYVLKVFLDCDSNTDYILEHIGCYDYCEGLICNKPEDEDDPETAEVTKYLMQRTDSGEYWTSYGTWTFTYKKETSTTKRDERTVYTAKKWVEEDEELYEYETTTTTLQDPYYSDWSDEKTTTSPVTESETVDLVDSYTRTVGTGTYSYVCDWSDLYKRVSIPTTTSLSSAYPNYYQCAKAAGYEMDGFIQNAIYYLYNSDRIENTTTVRYYVYRTRELITPEPETNIEITWVEEDDLPETTTSNKVDDITTTIRTRYTGEVQIVEGEGHYVSESPVKYYTSTKDFPAGYVLNLTKTQYRYKYYKSYSNTETKWIKSSLLDKYLNDGWKKIDEDTYTVEL